MNGNSVTLGEITISTKVSRERKVVVLNSEFVLNKILKKGTVPCFAINKGC